MGEDLRNLKQEAEELKNQANVVVDNNYLNNLGLNEKGEKKETLEKTKEKVLVKDLKKKKSSNIGFTDVWFLGLLTLLLEPLFMLLTYLFLS